MSFLALMVPVLASVAALYFVVLLTQQILAKPQGTDRMAELSGFVQEGAQAFLKREYTYIAMFVGALFFVFVVMGQFVDDTGLPTYGLDVRTGIAFLMGAMASCAAGIVGMMIATRCNSRTAAAALSAIEQAGPDATEKQAAAAKKKALVGALDVSLSGGAVMGLTVVGVSLLGLAIVVMIFGGKQGSANIINGYSLGASLVALFARCGGGIFTKGADMGADLVGKVEAGIPEDDPRNPAVIADNVGDNVGDVAGLGADLLESYVSSIIVPMAIAATLAAIGTADATSEVAQAANEGVRFRLTMLPMYIAAVGTLSSILGVLYVKRMGEADPQKALMNGTYIAAAACAVLSFVVVALGGTKYMEGGHDYGRFGPYWSSMFGVIAGIVVGLTTEYFTSSKYKPVRRLAENSQSGPALTVTEGISTGMASTAMPVLLLSLAVIFSYEVGGIYGVGMAALGMLATTGMVVSVDSYGPIADNAGGIAEMAHLDKKVRQVTDSLDAVGNTTAAIGKGFAIGSAAFAALGLVIAYCATAQIAALDVSLMNPKIIAGLFIGAMLPYLFSSFLFRAVSDAAFAMIVEVRRQFAETAGLKEGKEGVLPDYAKCVDIATNGAIKGMLLPGAAAIITPLLFGKLLGKEALAGLLLGSTAAGLVLGIQMATAGGAMDNAKKYVEEGHFGGKGGDTHKATVIGDTVGDPLKDTVGPSLNILMKLMAVISLVFAPMLRTIEPLIK